MKIHLISFALLASLLLSACAPSSNTPNTSKDPTQQTPTTTFPSEGPTPSMTTVPAETTSPIATTVFPEVTIQTTPTAPQEITTPIETSVPQPTTDPPYQQNQLESLFGDYYSWYNKALSCLFEDPKDLNLFYFFYNGFRDESKKPTDAEWALLKDKHGFDPNSELLRLPVKKMNTVLTDCFGLTLHEMNGVGLDAFVYLEDTNCYYFMATGSNGVRDLKIIAQNELGNDIIQIIYSASGVNTNPNIATYAVTLKRSGDGFLMVSNVPIVNE